MILDNVRVYDPYEESNPEERYHVVLDGERIHSVNKGLYIRESHEEVVVDGKGYTLTPGFTDSHLHLLRFGLLKSELDLTRATSFKEMKESVEKHYDRIEESHWIFGKGFNDGQFGDINHLLTAKDLNEINLDKYMYFMHQDGHECVISEKLLESLEQEEFFHEQPEAFKERDENGELTGRFKDTLVHFINYHLWERSMEQVKSGIKASMPYLLQYGITTVHTDDRSFIGTFDRLWQAYTELEQEGHLPITAVLHYYMFDKKDLDEFIRNVTLRTGDGTERVKVGAIKIFLDGTQRLHTAAMSSPYPDTPDTTGELLFNEEELKEIVRISAQNDMQVAIHALGDRAVETALSALQQKEARTDELRHRIIHAQTLRSDLLDRLQQVRPYIETQPSFLMAEWDEKDRWTKEELLPYCDAFQSMLNHDIPITLSSDAPIGSLNPLMSVYAAMTRQDLSLQPEGGWMPQERLTVNQSFTGFFRTPAELEFREHDKGRISPGYKADFALLSQHPMLVAPKEWKECHVVETWIRGERVYTREQ
ncbi:metal-dependent hydrolase [Pontibacillus halophilus JSM 076056 = DSM 19796]|uniref:Metal-dependent hydrolase n=1 Tax=Pontibacillus halophilus JSM 076056 = DSM 19796 TaxID=1385510 RepID=A0A0A5GIY6_9BACI|nr:amidohydrolase [Pontibacillus halophilus]KGX91964.1 metal-dependent hydrolase [Pontibacillus halophilus JSM 076056 = DSM 19796]